MEHECIGLKVGSLNTALAFRNEFGIETKHTRTCIRYPNSILKSGMLPIIGDEATKYADAKYPLALGIIEKEEGIQQTADILRTLDIPRESDIVLASPAVEMLEGKKRLAQAVKKVSNYNRLWVFSEGLCASVNVLKSPGAILGSTFFGINMGSTTTEFGCFSEGRIEHLSAHPEFCGNRVDNDILLKLRNAIGDIIVTDKEVRELKETANLKRPQPFILKSMTRGGIIEHTVTNEITKPIEVFVDGVAELIKKEIISNVRADIRVSSLNNAVVISGGMTNIVGLPEALKEALSKKLNFDIEVKYLEMDNHISPSIGGLLLCEEIVKEN